MLILTLALLLDWFAGDPDIIWKRIPHPVVLFGRVIGWIDGLRYKKIAVQLTGTNPDRGDLLLGMGLVVVLLSLSMIVATIIQTMAGFLGWFWWLVEVPAVAVLLAQKSLREHVGAVVVALKDEDAEQARYAVSMIVGRDVSQLTRSGINKASLESLAENYSDGVVAPAFWYAVFGLPGILAYKAINTADSMIGHRNEKYEYFGKPAAIFDDVLNWPAARISALLLVAVVGVRSGWTNARNVWDVTLRDAQTHRSPNAGWPEAAYASALGVALGGPRQYGEDTVNASILNAAGRHTLTMSNLVAGLGLFRNCCLALAGSCLFLWLLF